jgi:two-component system, response regulator PdtaR
VVWSFSEREIGTSRPWRRWLAGDAEFRWLIAPASVLAVGEAHAGSWKTDVTTKQSLLAVRAGIVPEKPTVLVVEDEVLIRLMLADELRGEGLQVLEAANADEALTVLQSSLPVHLLFTDIRMPGRMDGLALAKAAHARFPQIKRIIGSSARPEQSIDAFADAFLAKPYDLHELIKQVRRLLDQSAHEH